jgi:rubrerythrin
MSSFAEAVPSILVIVVILLAIRNGRLKREKEVLAKQLSGMRNKEGEGNQESAAAKKTAEVGVVPTGHCCPNCHSGSTEIYKISQDQEVWICRACIQTWLVASPPASRTMAYSDNPGWACTIQNTSCPGCGSSKFEMRTYGGPWEYADTHSAHCGKLIRRLYEA